jgi:hypothetical protein
MSRHCHRIRQESQDATKEVRSRNRCRNSKRISPAYKFEIYHYADILDFVKQQSILKM